MSHIKIIDGKTGVTVEREMNVDELAQQEADAVAHAEYETAVAAKEDARQSAIDKLAALGLTVDEISAAFGLENN